MIGVAVQGFAFSLIVKEVVGSIEGKFF